MIALNSIISTLSLEEQQKFTTYLEQKNKRKDTKNIKLFKLLAKDENDSKTICTQLYNTNQSNAYHALRKRLFQSLIDFTANKNLEDENSIDMQIIKYILASRTYLLKKNYDIAYKILDKAERLADEHLLFPILNEIYHTKIQYASNYPIIDLKELITKQKENQKRHQLEDQLNIVYAQLKSALNAISYEGKIINFEDILQNTLKDYDIKLNESLSFKSLYQILAIANISALVTTQYFQIENFVLRSYKILKSKKNTNKQLYYQIHIVYIIANTLFRNKKFESSLKYINEMEQLMLLKRSAYYKDFILKKTLVEALNYNYNNQQEKAIELIELIIETKHKDIESMLDLHLSLFMFYFQKEDFLKAKSSSSQFYHTDQWYIQKTGIDWVIKKNIAEILLYIELQEDDLFYSRLKSFRRRYSSYLKKIKQFRILTFLNFAEQYYTKPKRILTKEFKNKLETSFQWTTVIEEDIFVISFYAWLKNKMENGNLYETTLKLLKT
ncbi:hypothetical protein H8K90_14085 [Winogradskyella echinorum]|uniref:Uncharacterized protein n=1 Tax=Winogradskyella echinorum TaxID=538189 RepID=A0ABR6Y464_9FLAO|nr:hypothetical protein [Winogradskyella echinorum]MBC3847522.1 hypothetical protein [Winogradskyella echinorum]MBC5751870.1 hypothetical protein [Winogradskyella echinorum]